MKRVFSGIQPSGDLHIGNYIGAIKQWIAMQETTDPLFCIVDLHAITVPQDPTVLRDKILEVAALYLACGIDPEKSHIFIQSENPDHANLTWLLNCLTSFGLLSRMTQFKDKSQKQAEVFVGLFDYPVLMASDILLYDTDEVPVGEDQKQHLELTRDLAEKFNKRFGLTFKVPEPRIIKEQARIMSLQDPASKMSKSDANALGTIKLLDPIDEVKKKISRAVTDSQSGVNKEFLEKCLRDNTVNGTLNLLSIYAAITDMSLSDVMSEKDGMRYSELKQEITDRFEQFLSPIQERYYQIRKDEAFLQTVLSQGRDFAHGISSEVLQKASNVMGLGRVER
jgi:tryptophanyl-tRNA synthetase